MTTDRDQNGDTEVRPIITARGEVVLIKSEAGAVVLTITDHNDAVAIALSPTEAEQLAKRLKVEAYVAEHG